MKKFFLAMILVFAVVLPSFAEGDIETTDYIQRENSRTTTEALADSNAQALKAVPIPEISYFTERQTIARWYERWDRPSVVTYVYQVETPDIDGTYGTLNYGIRFFTAEGTAVEWGGMGATYLYSDAPLPINVPKLNVTAE